MQTHTRFNLAFSIIATVPSIVRFELAPELTVSPDQRTAACSCWLSWLLAVMIER